MQPALFDILRAFRGPMPERAPAPRCGAHPGAYR